MTCKRTVIMPDFVRWECRISDETIETYGLHPSPEEMQEDWWQHNIEEDQRQERILADQFIENLDTCPDWPDYADPCWEVQQPQIFGP